MVELPKTEEELNTLIEAKVNAKVEELTSKHNNDMAGMRKSYEEKIKKIQDQANLSAEDKAKQLAEEQAKAHEEEFNELKSFKKTTLLKERLVKEELPSYFANDSRLLTAEDGDLEKVIKVVKDEYKATLPKGNQHSTVIPTATGTTPNANDNKGLEGMADALKGLIS